MCAEVVNSLSISSDTIDPTVPCRLRFIVVDKFGVVDKNSYRQLNDKSGSLSYILLEDLQFQKLGEIMY